MHELDVAILKTVIYGDIFNFPMTAEEIHHFLIHNRTVGLTEITQHLQTSHFLANTLCFDGTYYSLASRQDIFELRHSREAMVLPLLKRVKTYGRLLAYFPFVEFVGVTGALSMRNPSTETDDLDYLIITRPGRVWLARACIILLVRVMRLRHVEICPNYVLASDKLSQSRQDMYIAHEIVQLLPLSNVSLYQQLREENQWTQDYLANSNMPFYQFVDAPLNRVGLFIKHGLEAVMSTRLGNWLEQWEYKRKATRFQQQATAPTSSAEIDEGRVKGHFQDYGHYVLERYHEQLKLFEIDIHKPQLQSGGD